MGGYGMHTFGSHLYNKNKKCTKHYVTYNAANLKTTQIKMYVPY